MKVGKFPVDMMERLLAKVQINDERVLLGPRVGGDAALIDYGNKVLVAKTDPVTFATDLIGWYAVQVNANDVACTGASPHWFLATLLVPETFTEAEAEAIFDQILQACDSLDVTLIGGHSEVTRGLSHPMVIGCMLGEVEKGKLVHVSCAKDGDSIVVTKGIALEGTALLARDAEESLANSGVDIGTIARAKELLFYPGISVLKDALTACANVTVNALHDPTEGGLVTGLWEISKAAGVGLAIEEGSIPILPECTEICQALNLDPLGLLASGALLITLPPQDVPQLFSALEKEGIEAFEIGQITGQEEGVQMISSSSHELEPLPRFERDELARFLSR